MHENPRRKVIFQPLSLCGPETLTWMPKYTIFSIPFVKFLIVSSSSPLCWKLFTQCIQTCKKTYRELALSVVLFQKLCFKKSLVFSARNPLARKNAIHTSRPKKQKVFMQKLAQWDRMQQDATVWPEYEPVSIS